MATLHIPSAIDDMDMLSDSGYGYGDGDIDIELDSPEHQMHHEDDDLELQDAATDNDEGLQVVDPDADQYMLDEHGSVNAADVEIHDAVTTLDDPNNQQSNSTRDTNQEPVLQFSESAIAKPGDEDLIDYSDEEDEVPQNQVPTPAARVHDSDNVHRHGDNQDDDLAGQLPDDQHHEGRHTLDEPAYIEEEGNDGLEEDASLEQQENYEEQYEHGYDEGSDEEKPTWDDTGNVGLDDDWVQHHSQPPSSDSKVQESNPVTSAEGAQSQEVHHEHNEQPKNDAFDAVQELESNDNGHTVGAEDQADLVQHEIDNSNTKQQEGTDQHYDDEVEGEHVDDAGLNEESRLHSVMLNYEGTEMFLFAPHQDQQPQMFLLADESVASETFHALFQACRAQLGESIKQDIEIGLRIDDLKNFEVYEDSVACASFCLKDIIDIYLTLHEQDGNTNPESLYLTFLFRPRVIAIYGDLQKAVRDQVGYMAFKSAAPRRDTAISHTDFHPDSESESEIWHGREGPDYEESDYQDDYQNGDNADASIPDSQAVEAASPPQKKPIQDLGHQLAPLEEKSSISISEKLEEEVNIPLGVLNAENSSANHKAADEYIGYSDDEDIEDTSNLKQGGQGPFDEASSGSSTVQGDNILGHEFTNPTNHPENDGQLDLDFIDELQGKSDLGGEDESYNSPDLHADAENFDANGNLNLVGHLDAGPAITAGVEGIVQDDFAYLAEADDDDTFDLLGDRTLDTSAGDFGPSEDYVDFDDAGEDATEAPVVADSNTGKHAATLSTGSYAQGSDQGVKRSIDEVDGAADSSDQSDDKRARL